MSITITLDCDNRAFGRTMDSTAREVARILEKLASHMPHSLTALREWEITDSNYNPCGKVFVSGTDVKEGGR